MSVPPYSANASGTALAMNSGQNTMTPTPYTATAAAADSEATRSGRRPRIAPTTSINTKAIAKVGFSAQPSPARMPANAAVAFGSGSPSSSRANSTRYGSTAAVSKCSRWPNSTPGIASNTVPRAANTGNRRANRSARRRSKVAVHQDATSTRAAKNGAAINFGSTPSQLASPAGMA